ncbi:MAG TPA: hypothetical protein VKZ45_02110 [Vicingaceae bacterium]|jgi:hypothetical protein|nr:hypothetical protein [Vicingaceae bacterium]
MNKHFFIFFIAIAVFANSYGQLYVEKEEVKDSSATIPLFKASFAYQFSGSDMAERFGANYNVGGSFGIKMHNNWYVGFKGNFLWGAEVKQNDILDQITTSDGELIKADGRTTAVFLDQRGSSFFLTAGRMFNVLAPNKNSGFLVYGGAGFLQHKISIKYRGTVNNLTDEHKKGYDRFSFGFALNGFAGYLFLSKNRLVNFYGGIDITQGWTKNLRKFNYDTGMPDNEVRSDLLYGFRVGWIIQLNKRTQDEFYYY